MTTSEEMTHPSGNESQSFRTRCKCLRIKDFGAERFSSAFNRHGSITSCAGSNPQRSLTSFLGSQKMLLLNTSVLPQGLRVAMRIERARDCPLSGQYQGNLLRVPQSPDAGTQVPFTFRNSPSTT